MRNRLTRMVLAGLTAAVLLSLATEGTKSQAAEKHGPMLAHDVYFTLEDDSPQAKKELVAACKKYLSEHPGIVWFSAGILVEEHQREVNDRDFDVALHMVFKDKASHDRYQDAPQHHKFIEEHSQNWKQVRVFDSYLDVTSHGDVPMEAGQSDRAKKPQLPEGAALFAGMIEGKVVKRLDAGVVLEVKRIPRLWRTNRAEDAESLIGKTVLVVAPKKGNRYAQLVLRFIASLKEGETITLDVAHREKGQPLAILELTEEQRERAEQ